MIPNSHPDRNAEADWAFLREVMNDSQPVQPSSAEWNRVRRNLQTTWVNRRISNRPSRLGILAGLLACAAGVILAFNVNGVKPEVINNTEQSVEIARELAPTPKPVIDPLAEFTVLPVATPLDVMIRVVRGDKDPGIVVVDHPIPGSMPLAKEGDVFVKELGNAELSQPEPGDFPVILGPGVP